MEPVHAPRGGWWVEWHSGETTSRVLLSDRLGVGRSASMDVVVDDPYVSREHCYLTLEGEGVRVDASRSLNRIRVADRDLESILLMEAGSFVIGHTTIHLRPALPAEDSTLRLAAVPMRMSLRLSTRELLALDGTLIARLSPAEATALQTIARRYPDAASHDELGRAVWGEGCYDRYLIHRLMQRLRERLGDFAGLVENVPSAGYRFSAPLELR